MRHSILKVLLTLLIFAVAFPAGIPAAKIEGSVFQDSLTVDGKRLELIGAGLLRYCGFKAYIGALYLEEDCTTDEVFLDRSKCIELEYMRPIKGKDFGPATDKFLAKNVDAQTLNQLRARIDYHNSLYEDVKPGDRYSLTYIPGRGTELALNNESKGIIQGDDFAAAIFSIWLGPKPINKSFKKQILGL